VLGFENKRSLKMDDKGAANAVDFFIFVGQLKV